MGIMPPISIRIPMPPGAASPLATVPVIYSPYWPADRVPALVDGVVVAHDEESFRAWMEGAGVRMEEK